MSRPAKLEPRLPTTLSEPVRTYLRPVGLTCGKAAQKLAATGKARRLANGPWFFAACEVVLRAPSKGIKRATAALEDIESWADTLAAPQRDRLRAQLQRLREHVAVGAFQADAATHARDRVYDQADLAHPAHTAAVLQGFTYCMREHDTGKG